MSVSVRPGELALADRRRQAAGALSGGQQQMLAIGMGLISPPALLALDEPSLGLAPLVVDHLYEVLGRLSNCRTLSLLSLAALAPWRFTRFSDWG